VKLTLGGTVVAVGMTAHYFAMPTATTIAPPVAMVTATTIAPPAHSDAGAVESHPTLANAGIPAATAPEGTALPAVLTRLRALAALEANWDGYGAPPPSRAAHASARRVITSMLGRPVAGSSGPHIAPGASGEIAIEWRLPDRELHVYCLADGTYEVLRDAGESAIEDEGNFELVADAVRWFVS
jgi:hypothetical protein